MKEKKLWVYRGPVEMFGKPVCNDWQGKTRAVSAKAATSNLQYQYKKKNGYAGNVVIKLVGNPTEEESA